MGSTWRRSGGGSAPTSPGACSGRRLGSYSPVLILDSRSRRCRVYGPKCVLIPAALAYGAAPEVGLSITQTRHDARRNLKGSLREQCEVTSPEFATLCGGASRREGAD